MKNKKTHGRKFSFTPKVFLLLFTAFLINSSLSAQSKFRVSFSGGLNNNDITYSASNRVNTEYVDEEGNYFKAGFNFKVYKHISIQTGLTYLNKNYRFQRTGTREGISTLHKSRYFNIPVMVGIQPLHKTLKNTKFNFEVFAGTYVGWWNSLKRESTVEVFGELDFDGFPKKTITESYDFDKNENHFNRVDYGLQTETRLGYNFHKNLSLFLEYSFMYGLSDNQKEQLRKTSNYYYTTSNYGIGISYNF
ncbi:PorT family protein [Tenacibaculum sp. 1B UA]|uniref:outer membrane beta-barrel protein n=1 Tax=Tenacibaculum sp. 1B UA TaxID=2922252 RepID=UPI002A23F863|nr:outer membrane beta-barrel protein [Tenacibaculum sp. 1B UA]MDX8552871.1 PorT family protein [Tenacibaculum sp. 1B UA]